MRIDLNGKFEINGIPVIFKEDTLQNVSSAVNVPSDLAAIIARQSIRTGDCIVGSKSYRYAADSMFLTIYEDGQLNSRWVTYNGNLVYFDPAGVAIVRK